MTLSALACGAAFLIARRHFRASTPATLILASVAWFSFSQWEAQFMGLVLHWYLYALGLALIASALKPLNLPRVVVGLLICASTLGAWLLLPPLVMAFILGGDQPRRPKLASCGAVIVSALVIGFWVPRVRSHSTLNVFRHIARSPGAFVDYALAYLGGPLFFVLKDVTLCIGAGVLWIALFLIAWLKFDLRKNPLVGFIGAHQVLFALALASGRMNLGVWQGTASRYLALSLPAWVLLLWHLSERVSFRKWGLVLLGFLAFTSARGLGYYVKRKVPDRRAGLECYRELKATGEWNRSDKDACLTKVSNSASEFREIARQLNREF